MNSAPSSCDSTSKPPAAAAGALALRLCDLDVAASLNPGPGAAVVLWRDGDPCAGSGVEQDWPAVAGGAVDGSSDRWRNCMLTGWANQQRSRMLSPTTIDPRIALLRRFTEFAGSYPWSWTASDVEDFTVSLTSQAGQVLQSRDLRGNDLRRGGAGGAVEVPIPFVGGV